LDALALSDLDDLSFGVPGLDGLALLLAHKSAGEGSSMRKRAMRGIGLVLSHDTQGLLATDCGEKVIAFEGDVARKLGMG
jgi:hypothetical protein